MIKARNLPKMDRIGSADPYCKLLLVGHHESPKTMAKTKVIKNRRSPQVSAIYFYSKFVCVVNVDWYLKSGSVELFFFRWSVKFFNHPWIFLSNLLPKTKNLINIKNFLKLLNIKKRLNSPFFTKYFNWWKNSDIYSLVERTISNVCKHFIFSWGKTLNFGWSIDRKTDWTFHKLIIEIWDHDTFSHDGYMYFLFPVDFL